MPGVKFICGCRWEGPTHGIVPHGEGEYHFQCEGCRRAYNLLEEAAYWHAQIGYEKRLRMKMGVYEEFRQRFAGQLSMLRFISWRLFKSASYLIGSACTRIPPEAFVKKVSIKGAGLVRRHRKEDA